MCAVKLYIVRQANISAVACRAAFSKELSDSILYAAEKI